jgi:hypothetical protein
MCHRCMVTLACRHIGLLSFEWWTFFSSGIFGFFLFHCQHTFEVRACRRLQGTHNNNNNNNNPTVFVFRWAPLPRCGPRRTL